MKLHFLRVALSKEALSHRQNLLQIAVICSLLISVFGSTAFASTPNPGGNTTVVNPAGEGAVSVTEDSPQPESANIRLIVPQLSATSGTPNSIRIVSVTGGALQQGGGGAITLGLSGTVLTLSSSRLDLRFAPASNRDTAASFQYVVVDPENSNNNSPESTATIPIAAVNDLPILQTSSGGVTGEGLAGTYYRSNWDLTGATTTRVDATVNFSSNQSGSDTTVWGIPHINGEQFSVRWSGKIKAPVTGAYTISTNSDDGVRVWLDDVLVINNWTLHGPTVDNASPVTWEAGTMHSVRMEFYERGGGEVAQLRWAYPSQATQIIPQQYLYPGTVRPTLTYLNGSGAVAVDDGLAITDADSTNMAGATISIGSYVSAEDSLGFTNQNGITGSFNSGTGVLTLTGTATLANYQTALRSVTYTNSDSTPTTTTRTITFLVSDSGGDSNTTTRDIAFTAENSAPVITEGTSASVTMDEDGSPAPFSLTLNATDTENNSLTWSIDTPASHGTASVSGTGVSKEIGYTPTANYSGSDSFVVKVADGFGGSDTVTVNVTVTARNDTPTFTEGSTLNMTIDEDNAPTAFSLTLHANDLDNDTLTWSVSSAASHGAAAVGGSGNTRSITYIPTANYSGSDSFTIRVRDGALAAATVTVNLTINAINDIPVATTDPTVSALASPVKVDYTLTADKGVWNDDRDQEQAILSYAYQWQRCTDYDCTSPLDIAGATGASYTLTSADQSQFIRLKLTVTDTGVGAPISASAIAYTTSVGQILPPDSQLVINQGKVYVNSRQVSVDVSAINILTGTVEMILSEDPTFAGANWQAFANTANFTLSNGDGKKTIYIKFRDAAGNESASYTNTIKLDTGTALVLTTVAKQNYNLATQSITTNNRQPAITGIADPYAKVTITIHSDPITGTTSADADGHWSWTPDVQVPYGNHTLLVSTTDEAGNTKQATLALVITRPTVAVSPRATASPAAVLADVASSPSPAALIPAQQATQSKAASARDSRATVWISLLVLVCVGFWFTLLGKRRKKKKDKSTQNKVR